MVVLGNILKLIATIIVGYIVGFLFGTILGSLFGIFISFIIQKVASSHQATTVSFFIALTLGCLLSSLASQVFNRLLETNIHSLLGAIPGALVGLVLVVFVYGYVEVADPNEPYFYRTINRIVLSPIMPYSATLGGQISAITFALFGAIGMIWETIKSHVELKRNRELMKNSNPANWGLPEIPREKPPLQATTPTRSFPSLQSRFQSAKGRVLFFFLKAFVSACAIGIILSTFGWQILGWNSGTQFSEGFFWTSALLAMYGYYNILGEHRVSRNVAMLYGETAGEMNIHERTRHWSKEAETSYAPFPNIFLISACLLGFAVLISIVF